MRILTIAILILALTSCKKYECVKTSSPEMIGEWAHLSENNGYHYIYIKKNGRGHMNGENNHGNTQDTQGRGWYIKDDVLYFSRFANNADDEKFTIDKYPTIAILQVTTEYDTIEIGESYMILNNRTYKKTQ